MSMRINGFSGMDIDSMVKSMMTVKRVPLDKLNQQKQILDWTRNSYRELNSKIVQFSQKLADMNMSKATNTQKSTVSGNTTAVKAEANADASAVALTVEVVTLAKKSGIQSNSGLLTTGGDNAKSSTTLGELSGNGGLNEFDLNINGKTVQFLKGDSISTVVSRINSSIPTVTAAFDEVSGKFTITSKEFGKTISDLGEKKDIDPITGEVTIVNESKSSSLFAVINFSDTTDPLSNGKKFGEGGTLNFTKGEVKITSALDDPTSTTAKSFYPESDTLTVNGIKLTLLETTSGTPSKITTQSDPSKAVETIKSFVDTYNELLGLMNSKLSEQKYRDYTPLTSEQKKDMTEDDIKNWEERAKSGLLKNDTILSSTVASMRTIITSNLKGLSEAGITTGQYYEKGKLQIDEAKLNDALSSNPDKVLSIFRGSISDIDGKGIFSGLRTELNSTLDLFVKKVGTSNRDSDASMTLKTESIMGEQLKNYNKGISDLERKMTAWETRYYKQFAAMEKAMNQFQSQSSSLSSYFQ
ncbi:flagellar filament capping protein FliD [Paenibacillus sp. PK1-4R]|uniref:flagellar filament capping protein FliD n=1 Tax=Paenibacillus sp. PK1-4R TaxID=3049075 RepID=UPI0025A2ED13|nr:flagellar filament capping protein FliD [Paenibacillus sp. PK1-4R]WJM07851.1 flagellar filament capping protein FliD [Paenibacillus sp. PK1-4R]